MGGEAGVAREGRVKVASQGRGRERRGRIPGVDHRREAQHGDEPPLGPDLDAVHVADGVEQGGEAGGVHYDGSSWRAS